MTRASKQIRRNEVGNVLVSTVKIDDFYETAAFPIKDNGTDYGTEIVMVRTYGQLGEAVAAHEAAVCFVTVGMEEA